MSGEPNSAQPPDVARAPAASAVQRLAGLLGTDARRLASTGVPHLLVALLLTQGLSMLRRVLLARLLSTAEQGQMAFVMALADQVAVVADLGICTAVLKYAAEPVSEQRRCELYNAGLLWSTVAATVIGALYALAVTLFQVHPEPAVRTYAVMVTPYVVCVGVGRIPLVFMQARREIRRAAWYTSLTQALSLCLQVWATYRFGLWGFFVFAVATPFVNLGLLLGVTRHALRRIRPAWVVLKQLLAFGLPSLLANIAGTLAPTLVLVLARHFTGSDERVGALSIALIIMQGSRLAVVALMQTALPYLSGLLHDWPHLRRRIVELALKQTIVMTGLTLVWWLVGDRVINLLFTSRYADAYWPSVLLMTANIPYAVSAATAQGLLILNRVKANLMAGTLLAALTAAGCGLFIPRYGTNGAAVAFVAAHVVATVFSGVMLWRTLRGPAGVSSARAVEAGQLSEP